MIADPSLLKYNSFAAALIWGVRGAFRSERFCLLTNEVEDIEAKDDSLFDGIDRFLSITLLLEHAKDPTDETPAKVEAICHKHTTQCQNETAK